MNRSKIDGKRGEMLCLLSDQFTHAAAVCITDQLTLTGAHAGGRLSTLELLRLLLKRP